MVNKELMYKEYSRESDIIISNNNITIDNNKKALSRINNVLVNEFSDDIDVCCTLNITELLKVEDLDDVIFHKSIKEKETEILKLLEAYIQIRDKVNSLKFVNKNIKKDLISYKKYSFVLKRFNDLLIDKLVEGYKFNPGYYLGSIYVKQKPQSSNAINWKESNEAKAKLIEDGKLPLKKFKDENGKITGDNGGIEWLVFRKADGEDFRYLVHWEINKCKNKNRSNYVFQPTHSSTAANGRKTFVTRIQDKLESDKFAHINFIR